MSSLEAFLRASSRAPRSVISLALSATLEALPKNPPSRLLAPPRMLPAVPSLERMNSLR